MASMSLSSTRARPAPTISPEAEALAKELLELTAQGVSVMTDTNFFSGEDTKEGPVFFGPRGQAVLQKTGGTTRLSALGIPHICYTLDLADVSAELKLEYTIYVNPAVDDPMRNRRALVKVIRWFITNFNSGTTFTHDESAVEA
ncbi:hypothetical protein GSI_02565 [Ganoderma sinense ZZ0214-1]|uniref:Uncharacterized protein n=1 Tax=Ganoderma sinense ZZ0214-1 TaxID=1077348 RepID=A0A2G8SMH7_9APHY|nr:hypothetical protein GSI_02565 [Ganoderma sinense ZZ0214-1]